MDDRHNIGRGSVRIYQGTCLALGQLVIEFAHLLHTLETATVNLMAPATNKDRLMYQAALGDRTAKPIMESFCTVFATRHGNGMAPEDLSILKRLSGELQDLAARRNRMMHDAWFSTFDTQSGRAVDMTLHRVVGKVKGSEIQAKQVHSSEIDDLARDCVRLNGCVTRIGWVKLDDIAAPRISSVLVIFEGQVWKRGFTPSPERSTDS